MGYIGRSCQISASSLRLANEGLSSKEENLIEQLLKSLPFCQMMNAMWWWQANLNDRVYLISRLIDKILWDALWCWQVHLDNRVGPALSLVNKILYNDERYLTTY